MLPGHADRYGDPVAVHFSGQLFIGHLLSVSRPVPAGRSAVTHLWSGDMAGSSESSPGRIHRLYDPGHRAWHHSDNCCISGRIIRFYLVVSRKTE